MERRTLMFEVMILTVILWCAMCFGADSQEKRVFKIGGIFHERNYDAEVAFKYAIDRVNMYNKDFEITPVIKTITSTDSFKAGKVVCELTSEGVAAIFGPESLDSKGIVESVCEKLEVPSVQTSWDPDPTIRPSKMSINFYPDQEQLSVAMAALVADYDWTSFTILYEDDDGLVRLQEVLKQHKATDSPISLKQLAIGEDNRPLLKEVRTSGEVHIILDCAADRILDYLRQANEVKLMEDYQSYILTSIDAHTIDFAELKYGRSNVTCFRMLDPTSYELRSAVRDWEMGEKTNNRPTDIQPESVRLGAALMNDAVNHFSKALADLYKSQGVETMSVPCDQPSTWSDGLGLAQYMKMIASEGLTGMLKFDEDGKRKEFILDIVELSKVGFKKIGFWDAVKGVNYTRTTGEVQDILAEKWQNKTFIVTSRLGAPFLMLKETKEGEVLLGNNRFEGYSLDLIDGISKILNFTYVFELVADTRYGSYNKDTKKWDGLVRELLDRKADLAICDLTITYERRTAVDFTMPFMTLGISILYAKADKKDPDLFSFLSPLSVEVWIYMATAYLGISILLFILGRMAPQEWLNPHPCNKNPAELENTWNLLNCLWLTLGSLMAQGCDLMPKMSPNEWSNPHPCDNDNPELENILTLMNSMWLMMGSLLQQGSDIMPKAVSTRMVAGMWWFFTLIMISSYTANLAAFLTNERMDAGIDSAEDLAKQTKIKYGAVLGGSTSSFFKDSNFSTYKRMWAAMESTRPSVFVKSNDEGRDRVSKGKWLYAFIMESISIEYIVERHCDLQQIGGQLDSKGYGIAMPMNSPYRTAISGAVLKMQEEGKLHLLKTKWWKEMHGGGSCKDDVGSDDTGAAELGIDNVGGVFVVLGSGCGIAFLIAVIEFLWNVRKVAVEEKVSLSEALKGELKFALNIWETTKPVHTASSGSTASSASPGPVGRAASEARSVLHAASSFMRLDKIF